MGINRFTGRVSRGLVIAVSSLSVLGVAAAAGAAAKDKADAAAVAEARSAVSVTLDQVIAVLAQEKLTIDQRRAQIEQIAYDNFDFETMSKLVLKRDWKKFSKAQRSEFIAEFKTYLSHSYGSRLERYNQEEIRILGDRAEMRGDVTVQTAVVGGQFDGAKVDYRMRKVDARWLAIDVTIEGVSLVSNFNSQFAGIVGRGGPEELLKQLREKNAEPALAAAETAKGG